MVADWKESAESPPVLPCSICPLIDGGFDPVRWYEDESLPLDEIIP